MNFVVYGNVRWAELCVLNVSKIYNKYQLYVSNIKFLLFKKTRGNDDAKEPETSAEFNHHINKNF